MKSENDNEIANEEVACINCIHYGQISSWVEDEIPLGYLKDSGECRCKSPQISPKANGVGLAVFPIVRIDMWCGKFKNWLDDTAE